MIKTSTLLLIFFSSIFMSHGQTITVEQIETKQKPNIILATSQLTEPIPTPEEQGFTKYIENGIVIYRKESNGVITEFIPKQ